ncbi:MAG: UDP-N-acetylmuramoyl-L-alanyl-D-glutamate--2,6-diaminopimelate ligase [Gammaproteobacteria bacterium]
MSKILQGEADIPPSRDMALQGLAMDSREVGPGYLFLAVRGHDHHGLKHLAEARDRGACAVAYEPEDAVEYLPALKGLPAFAVHALDQHAGHMAARFYGDPSATQNVTAVTGTNGKTSVSLITAQLLTELGKPCGVLGTLGYGVYGDLEEPTHTTPDAVNTQRWLACFRDRRAQYVSMEASSHALDQGRVNGVHVNVAVFTNLTHDHLDYHGSMERYGAAKRRLFELPGLKYAVINLDDPFGRAMAQTLSRSVQCIGYALDNTVASSGKMLRASNLVLQSNGMEFEVSGDYGRGHVTSNLLGRFNAQNLLAVLGVLLALDVPFDKAVRTLNHARTVPGRMECFGGGTKPLVVVDYAHTPDALEKAITATRAHCRGQLWCVFGCGGERDRGKRPQMGAIAEKLADRVIITDDNPRHEDGDAIVADILAGIGDHRNVQTQRDRARAIAQALHAASKDDVVLVAGKGHETYQVVGDRNLSYSDRDMVAALLKETCQ